MYVNYLRVSKTYWIIFVKYVESSKAFFMSDVPESEVIKAVSCEIPLGESVLDAYAQQEQLITLTTKLKKALMHKLFTEGSCNEPQRKYRTLLHQFVTAQMRVDDLNLSALNLQPQGGNE